VIGSGSSLKQRLDLYQICHCVCRPRFNSACLSIFIWFFARFTSSPSGTCGMSQGGRTATKLDSFAASLIGPDSEANCLSRAARGRPSVGRLHFVAQCSRCALHWHRILAVRLSFRLFLKQVKCADVGSVVMMGRRVTSLERYEVRVRAQRVFFP
jgi:hypothetical protein